jgi:uncharacterized membrane protein
VDCPFIALWTATNTTRIEVLVTVRRFTDMHYWMVTWNVKSCSRDVDYEFLLVLFVIVLFGLLAVMSRKSKSTLRQIFVRRFLSHEREISRCVPLSESRGFAANSVWRTHCDRHMSHEEKICACHIHSNLTIWGVSC